MTEPTDAPRGEPETPTAQESARAAVERRRRLAKVFGEVLPEGTSDERGDAWGDRESGGTEEWLRRQVPPHHG
ncbi:MAG: hypothetical protein ACXVXH_11635 [Nocardioidaceae bacterium]